MDTKTLAALKEAIAHWRRAATGRMEQGEGVGSIDCALCKNFLEGGCTRCPVMRKTGLRSCSGTPYWNARRAFRDHGAKSRAFKTEAKKMLDFLVRLLPKQTPKKRVVNKKNVTALKKSIEHWKRLASGKRNPGESIFTDDCALCTIYLKKRCAGCPIAKETEEPYCSNSPYIAANEVYHDLGLDSKQFKEKAKDQVLFLQKLLRKEKRGKLVG